MTTPGKIEISVDHRGKGSFKLNGVDVSVLVSHAVIEIKPGEGIIMDLKLTGAMDAIMPMPSPAKPRSGK